MSCLLWCTKRDERDRALRPWAPALMHSEPSLLVLVTQYQLSHLVPSNCRPQTFFAKDCPGGCSGALGVCNSETGQCMCRRGSHGKGRGYRKGTVRVQGLWGPRLRVSPCARSTRTLSLMPVTVTCDM